MYNSLKEKLKDSLKAVLPIVSIVMLLCLFIAPMPAGTMLCFLFGACLLVIGMTFFTLGSDVAMETMGRELGIGITKTKNLPLIILSGFAIGVLVTISEPDLTVLADQVQDVPTMTLVWSVAIGVGLFLAIALLRMLFSIALPTLLIVLYGIVFALTCLVPKSFLSVAFDAGGVTTGPMTVPFIMAMGIGISTIRSDKHASDDSFGLIAISSVGPIIAVLILGMLFGANGSEHVQLPYPDIDDTKALSTLFFSSIPDYMKEISASLLPIFILFVLYDLLILKIEKKKMLRILIGIVYTYSGLVLFLTGANVGFMPAGTYLGSLIAACTESWILIPIGMLIGYFIVMAEPAVYVLMHQVEELSAGAIPGRSLRISLSAGVSVSVGLSMLRVLTGISLFWFIVPGYAIAIVLSFFVPKIFTAIAFDSGGVASGPMTATFLLPLAIGACEALGRDVTSDAFGVVAMVAMTPLITIQINGLVYKWHGRTDPNAKAIEEADELSAYGFNEIIEL